MQISAKVIATLAKREEVPVDQLASALASGRAVLLGKKNPVLLSDGARTKIGVGGRTNFLPEADFFVCTESSQKKLNSILKTKRIPTGAVPLYALSEFDYLKFLGVLEQQLKLGADFVVLSPGVTAASLPALQKRKRIVAPSAKLITAWMARQKQDSPLYERFEEILAMIAKYSAALYLATSLRPASFSEVGDLAQLKELEILGQLTQLAWRTSVPVLIEGPDLLPFNKIVEQVTLIRGLTYNAPLIFRGPQILGDDAEHQSAPLGGTLASFSGVAGFIADTVGVRPKIASENFQALRRAAEAGSLARRMAGK